MTGAVRWLQGIGAVELCLDSLTGREPATVEQSPTPDVAVRPSTSAMPIAGTIPCSGSPTASPTRLVRAAELPGSHGSSPSYGSDPQTRKTPHLVWCRAYGAYFLRPSASGSSSIGTLWTEINSPERSQRGLRAAGNVQRSPGNSECAGQRVISCPGFPAEPGDSDPIRRVLCAFCARLCCSQRRSP